MLKPLLLWISIEIVALTVIFIGIIHSIIKKKELVPTVFTGKEDIVVKILILAAVVFLVIRKIIPECRDIPYAYRNELYYMEGVAQTRCDKSVRGPHYVIIKNEESEEMIGAYFSYDDTIEKGDYLKIKYLPNSKRAILLEINGRRP